MTGNYYLHLSSKDAAATSYRDPTSSFTDFTVNLPLELFFSEHRWNVALTDISLTSHSLGGGFSHKLESDLPQGVTVLSDIVANSYYNSGLYPILRILGRKTTVAASLQHSFYTALSREKISKVRVYLLDENLRELDISKWVDSSPREPEEPLELRCLLHFTTLLNM